MCTVQNFDTPKTKRCVCVFVCMFFVFFNKFNRFKKLRTNKYQ